MRNREKLVAGVAILALAVPATAIAGKGSGNGHGKTKPAQYIVKGTYAGAGVVSVAKASGHARKAGWVGQDVAFDLSSAQINTADHNLDGVEDLTDVAAGTPVRVKARLPKGDPGAGPYVAQRLDDKSVDDEDEEETEETEETEES